VVVAAFGSAKARVLAAALAAPGSELPLALLLQRAARSLLLLDPDAAASLPRDLRASREALSS
jgi:6-phosphogluconolactonase/glucosamine-6-phosphate isomerase/deaminase